jgi:hypothetical protein
MKTICFSGYAVTAFAVLFICGPSAAGSIEDQCRSTVRAEMKGPNCRQVTVFYGDQYARTCAMDNKIQMIYVDRVIKCVAQSGPGHSGVGGLSKALSPLVRRVHASAAVGREAGR